MSVMSDIHTLDAIESLTVLNARAALMQGCAAISAGQTVFDLGSVKTVDSAAVAVLLAWQRKARRAGVELKYLNLPASLQSLANLYGVDGLLVDSPANLQHH